MTEITLEAYRKAPWNFVSRKQQKIKNTAARLRWGVFFAGFSPGDMAGFFLDDFKISSFSLTKNFCF